MEDWEHIDEQFEVDSFGFGLSHFFFKEFMNSGEK